MNLNDILQRRGERNPNNIKPMNWILAHLWNFLRPKLVNFKTTIAGIGSILLGLSTGWKELETLVGGGVPDTDILTLAGGQIVVGAGMLWARDADKTTLESIGPAQLRKHGLIVNEQPKEGGR